MAIASSEIIIATSGNKKNTPHFYKEEIATEDMK
jgi:hypothetical protein